MTIQKCIAYTIVMKINVDKIWIFIKENCKTQKNFADFCGVHRWTIGRALASGECSFNIVARMATVMGVEYSDLMLD